MNGLEGVIVGWVGGIVTTFIGIMLFTKYMNNRDELIEKGKNKYKEKKG